MRIEKFLLGLPLLLVSAPAQALLCGTITVSASALTFGSYDPSSATMMNTGISARCPLGLAVLPDFTVGLTSQNASDQTARFMTQGDSRLNYNIYTTGGYGTVWGNSAPNTVSYNALLLLGSANFTAYGRIPAGLYVAAGAYGDIITVTVSY